MRRRRLDVGAIPLVIACSTMACGGAVQEAATDGSSGSAETAGPPGAAESGGSVTGDEGPAPSTSAAPGSSSSDATATSAESSGESSGDSTGGGALGCDELPLCDGFEGDAPGGPPDPSRWSVVSPDCSGAGTLAITDEVAHGGAQSVRIDGGGGYCDHVFLSHGPAIAESDGEVWVRVWLRLEQALGPSHVTFAALTDAADGGAALRMGGQSGILMWNRESDDATLPALSPTGISMSVAPVPGAWTCVEFMIDGRGGRLSTFVDGDAVAALQVDGRPTADVDQQWLQAGAWNPDLVDLQLGWESYGGSPMVLFVDDVAVSGERVGCEG